MLDAGLNAALGGKLRPILYVENEAFCAANLAWQMEEKFIPAASIWNDVRTITSTECRDYVCAALGGRRLDFILGGIPCQPYSAAGKRRGGDDERDLWPTTIEAIKVYEPSFVLIENVGGMASHVDGARRLLHDLAVVGYRAKAGLFSSKECGASHERQRWFFLGITDNDGCKRKNISLPAGRKNKSSFEPVGRGNKLADATKFAERKSNNEISTNTRSNSRRSVGWCSLRLANAERAEWRQGNERKGRSSKRDDRKRQTSSRTGERNEVLANAEREQHQRRRESADVDGTEGTIESTEDEWQRHGKAAGDSDLNFSHYAPARNDFRSWAAVAEMDAANMPAIESTLRGVAHGLANWALQLHAIGNGCDPLCAANAFVTLWACMQED